MRERSSNRQHTFGVVDGAHIALGVVGELMITAGVVMLLFVAWQLWWTDLMSARRSSQELHSLRSEWQPPAPSVIDPIRIDYGPPPDVPEPPAGHPWAVLHVPSFGSKWGARPITNGVTASDLKSAVGWYNQTALPGAIGNFSVAGHRVTYGKPFNQVDELQPGDVSVVETQDAYFIYRMRNFEIVRPWQIEVIAPVPGDSTAAPTQRLMTFTACHPEFSAQERYIVHWLYDRWQPKSAGAPPEFNETEPNTERLAQIGGQ